MIRHGKAPYLECSSAGDLRFSALHAQVSGNSIERRYQTCKIIKRNGHVLTFIRWQDKKGLKPSNLNECKVYYSSLWNRYIRENPALAEVLAAATGLSDQFGQPGHVCQATELWRIRDEILNGRWP